MINWNSEGKVVFTMYNYWENILDKAPADFDSEDVTPAFCDLFTGNLTHKKLDTSTLVLFHRVIAKFLYIAKRTRPNIQVAVAFLCKRVTCPNVGDWKKLGRLVQYIQATIHLSLIVGLDGTRNMLLSIDALFVVHMNIKSYTGYCLTLGIGLPISGSFTQKWTLKVWPN